MATPPRTEAPNGTLSAVHDWVAAAEKQQALQAVGFGEEELAELKRLRKENAELKLEKEILRKAAQYFAREMGR
jgi:transposase